MKMEIKGPFIRLDQLLKLANMVSTGGEAKFRIEEGEVQVNGEVCFQRGRKIKENDVVCLNGETIEITFV